MIIQLTSDRRLSSDAHQYTLEKKRTVKNKDTGEQEEKWVSYKFYGTLKNAVKSVPEQLLRESDANGLTEVLRLLRTTERQLLQALGE